jgi:hypothetical protein
LEIRLLYTRPTHHGRNVHFQTAQVANEFLCRNCAFHLKQVIVDNPAHIKKTEEAWFEQACALEGERYVAFEQANEVLKPVGVTICPARASAFPPPKPDTSTEVGRAQVKAASILGKVGVTLDPRIRKERKPKFVYDTPITNAEGETTDASVFDKAIPWAEAVQPAPSRSETDLDNRDLIKSWLKSPESNYLRPRARMALELWASSPELTQRDIEARTGMSQSAFCDAKKNALNRARRRS